MECVQNKKEILASIPHGQSEHERSLQTLNLLTSFFLFLFSLVFPNGSKYLTVVVPRKNSFGKNTRFVHFCESDTNKTTPKNNCFFLYMLTPYLGVTAFNLPICFSSSLISFRLFSRSSSLSAKSFSNFDVLAS